LNKDYNARAELSNNSSLACLFRRWKGLFPLAGRKILPVDFSAGDVNTH